MTISDCAESFHQVNDFCEFPVRLDMSPYMKQKSGDDIYILEGILVHSGTAESGHYYSFVKEGVAEKWFQFNDVSIEPFDPCDIPSACFGGTDTIPQFDPLLLKSIPEVVPKTHSAYMLFYQREALLKEEKNGIEVRDNTRGRREGAEVKPQLFYLLYRFPPARYSHTGSMLDRQSAGASKKDRKGERTV